MCENGATKSSGCDTCPDGTSVYEYEDGQCPPEVVTTPPPTTTPPPDSGGGGGDEGGGKRRRRFGGGFSPTQPGRFDAGVSGSFPLLSGAQFPIVDYLFGQGGAYGQPLPTMPADGMF